MELLKQKILLEGTVLNEKVLKVDSFLNHQLDPVLTMQIGAEFARRFEDCTVDKILTIESSGIAVALATAVKLNVPLVFARKKRSLLMSEEAYTTEVYSYTKQETNHITVLKKFLPAGEKVLIIDDFLASGAAASGLAVLARQAGCEITGIGIVIEKSFQGGAAKLRQAGYRVESLVRIGSLKDGKVTFL
ncbi:xanthine phosphoribosyltransferase|uniref:Xanthine phosphoribosyltransferase n=1 Tax=Dendrosporobacter quercicolus TaxID=146817 RepID=A0A1G9Q2S4_9FIRM|nr:xanthine phosphoribosyltransferase [Dendrosporobacter quercicolus]NSL48101.1 xanthine phosphoribosyltransferase [Dendrosporobacter quercicolus DSM 1736]SDM05352.1 xanthine phosphoribosyltransferase [Dendrosporobacter quercicolus]